MPTSGRWAIAVVLAAVPLAIPNAASAGGAVFDFDQRYYVPGHTAIGHVTFGAGSYGLENVHRGPFYAYLTRGNSEIRAPRIPRNAIPVGEMRILPLAGPTYRATVRFTVPDLPSGWYTVEYCNDPCTASGIGELVGGGFQVFGSREEARAAHVVERAERRTSTLHSHLQVVQRKNRELASTLRGVEWARDVSFDRAKALQAELDEARSSPDGVSTPVALVGWLLFAATALLWAGRSLTRVRRRPTPVASSIRAEERVEERPPARELEPVP